MVWGISTAGFIFGFKTYWENRPDVLEYMNLNEEYNENSEDDEDDEW